MIPIGTLLGKLELWRVYDFYDAPRIFSARNATGTYFLAFWSGTVETQDEWLYVSTSPERLNAVVEGELALREAFKHPENDVVWHVITSELGDSAKPLHPAELAEDWLPPVGDRLVVNRLGWQ
jgi:hypothetical protein